MIIFPCLLILALASPAPGAQETLFSDVTAASGVPPFRHGEGAAFQDLDGDGLPELYLPNVKRRGLFLWNRGDLRYSDETVALGVEAEGGIGAAIGDLDGDRTADLYVTRGAYPYGTNVLYLGEENRRFTDRSAGSGAAPRRNGISASLIDYDRDGDLDIYVANWGPDNLYRNDGAGAPRRFRDVAAEAGLAYDARSWGSVWGDFDGDGHPDLLVAQGDVDGSSSRLYRNRGDGTFADQTARAGLGRGVWAMAPLAEDFDNDGDLDLFLTNWTGPDQLLLNDGTGRFRVVTPTSGIASGKSVGATSGDVDGDGRADILVAGFRGPVRGFRNLGDGRFQEATGGWGLDSPDRNEGIVLADMDADGDLDLYVANYAGENRLYRNNLATGEYYKIRPSQNGRPAIGAEVRLYESLESAAPGTTLVARRDLQGGYGFCSQGPQEVLIRSPRSSRCDVEVTFPDGRRVRREALPPGSYDIAAPPPPQ